MKNLHLVGITALAVSGVTWMFPILENNNIFPETRVCFRPKEINSKKNEHLLNCDSNARVGTILSSVFNDLNKRDIEFSGKVAADSATTHFDSNLDSVRLSVLGSMGLGVFAIGCFSTCISDLKKKRNVAYHQLRKDYTVNQFLTDNYLNPVSDNERAIGSLMSEKQLVVNVSELDKLASTNDLETAKNRKEIEKLSGSKSDSQVSGKKEKPNTAILKALKEHEDGWLIDLINSVKPIFLIGDMGSAKTSFAVSVALIRESQGHVVDCVSDRHLNGENNDKWKLLKATRKNDNDDDILTCLENQIERRVERIAEVPKKKEQFILDEFTQLAKISSEAKQLVSRFVTSTYSDTRKAQELFIGVTHSFTNASFGDGVFELRQRGWLIEKFSVNGETPIPRVVIRTGMKDSEGNNLENVEKTLPDWFRPEIISNHLNGTKLIDF
ncbi:MAG: ATP-binding protein [Richelia sp. SM1_7_0]|nr:ATP-binding protein [Richelia sp. SM1_7_0]